MQNNETMAGRHLSTQDDEDDRLVPSPRGSRQKASLCKKKKKQEHKHAVSSWAVDQIAISIPLLLQPSDGEWMD